MASELRRQAEQFAESLSEIVNGTLSKGIEFKVTLIENDTVAFIAAEFYKLGKTTFIPIIAGLKDGEEPWIWLNVTFKVKLEEPYPYLTVQTSVFALAIDQRDGNPAVRIEFDRDRGYEPEDTKQQGHNRSAAHVQIHGVSPEISYIQGRQKAGKLKPLQDFHFPVGGRRFRPSLEDFIEFIYKEGFVTSLHEGSREVINRHRAEWLAIQLRAAVKQSPDIAAEKLRELGYEVTKLADQRPGTSL